MDADRWQRATELFEAVLDRPEADQRGFLEAACAGDVALLHDVQALIAEDRRTSILDIPIDGATLEELAPLRQIGPYVLGELLGLGGMGEVFRAHDSRLGRDVAIKILPAVLAADTDRLARFKREAQVLAALNHPNIATIYGVEREGAVEALVLELVEGPTVADRLDAGAIPVAEAVAIASQLAEALSAAHDAGVMHRDLKPANVKVRDDGVVKVLDFGLARFAAAPRGGARPRAGSPTITTAAATVAGLLLGTAAYMSPEQARGKVADQRSDVWAFGCVVFEMLSGVRAFPGDEVGDTLAAVLRAEPDWQRLPTATPPSVARVLRRCLEKDPARRYHAIADARLDLTEPVPAADAVPSRAAAPARERLIWAALALTLAGGLAYTVLRAAPAQDKPAVRFQIAPPARGFYGSIGGAAAGGISGATVSPDGSRLAFVATDADGRTSLWLRPLDADAATSVPDTEGASLPFWSPDSRSVGFFANERINSADVVSGAVRVVAAAPLGRGGTWGRSGVIVFTRGNPTELVRVSADGGPVTPIAVDGLEAMPQQAQWPSFLPDGRHFLYWARAQPFGGPGLAVASIDPGERPRPLVSSDTAGVVLPSGILLFTRGQDLLQQRFDLERLEVTGDATRVNESVLINQGAGLADFSVSTAGTLVYQPRTNLSNQFAWLDRTGRVLETVGRPGRFRCLALSPDGRRLAYEDQDRGDLWLLDLTRQTESRFTSDPAYEACPVWFPDGSKIAYRSDRGGVFEKDVSGTTPPRRLLDGIINGPSQVTADGRWLIYFQVPAGAPSQEVMALPLTRDGPPRTLVASPFADVEPQVSPDGRWLAYASLESGRNEIYVQPFPPTGARWQVSSDGGRQPVWRADGRELFFVTDNRRFYSVDVAAAEGRFDYGVPRFLFDMRANVFNVRNSYAPTADGQRFLVNTLLDSSEPLTVVLNWTPR